MTYVVFLLSMIFLMGFIGFSSKPSPIYGGLGLIISGGVGCGMVLSFGGVFVGLMVFLIYLGGMLVVFGYTTAMAMEEYPEAWGSSVSMWGVLLLGLLLELFVVVWMVYRDSVGFKSLEDWVAFGGDMFSLLREDSVGVASLYGSGSWLMGVAGWTLFVTIFIVLEITRGF
ncbi:NADH dehydrogenase subunit 6 (mitochondrion) [Carlito syrichta]|uniref:NADH-ubiquinone oxidoreductase chain 6 n=1 Tax=Carlito syrichta TaxID=1868482 RepID=C4T954_CARSF|nr:NADH dehydrogenase subunit 6 [Carlito syrichta]BAH69167.1 NADH dehydrogenase subunit 6 [Carlito syrichta]